MKGNQWECHDCHTSKKDLMTTPSLWISQLAFSLLILELRRGGSSL